MQKHRVSLGLLVLLCSLTSQPLLSDTLVLVNGDQLTGTLNGISNEIVEFDTEYAGLLRIKQDQVSSLDTERKYWVVDENNTTISIQISPNLDIADLHAVRQDTRGSLEGSTGVSNRLTASLAYSQGNSTTQLYVLTSKSEFRRSQSEHILSTLLNYDVAEGDLLKNETQLNYKGRRFIGERSFLTFVTDAYRDPLKGTDLRLSPVLGIGRNLWDHTYGQLTIESGIAAIYEWQEEEQLKSPALSWELSYSKRLFGGRVELSHDHRILRAFGEGNVVESSNELKFMIAQNLDINLLARFKHDTEVPLNVEKTDITYVAGIGLSF